MLKLESVSLLFENAHRAILKDVNLRILPGDFVVLVGGNGSGKSSLLKLMNGLYKPTSGKILLQGQSILNEDLESIAQKICTLTQDLTLSTFSSLTVLENCELASLRYKQKLAETDQLKTFLDQFHTELRNHLETPVQKLSGGQRQALALAMALLHPPKLLLLDEHTSALDPQAARQIMKMTADMVSQHNITAIMITHDVEDALYFGNRLLALKEGKIIFEAAKEDKAALTKQDLLRLCY